MVRVEFKDAYYNRVLDDVLIVDANLINRYPMLEEVLLNIWLEEFNECICDFNESITHCECDGKYGSNLELEMYHAEDIQ